MYGRQYYQQVAPSGNWGTDQYQLGRPPQISFQPQPNWSGLDYFNAHAFNADPNIYNQAFASLGNYNLGASRDTAKRWHRRIYASDPGQYDFMPEDLGYAAAYEAYRSWKYNTSLSQPLSGDRERQREALIGLAIAEATRLMNTTYYAGDHYKRGQACNAAAATAAELYRHYDSRTNQYSAYGGRALSRPGSSYGSDDDLNYRGRSRSRSRSRYAGRSRSRGGYADPSYSNPMAIPGVAGSGYSMGSSGSYGVEQPYGSYPTSTPYSPYTPGSFSSPHGFPNSIPITGSGVPYAPSNTMPMIPPHYERPRSRSFTMPAYPQSSTPYMPPGQALSTSGYYPQQPQPQVYPVSSSGYGQPMIQNPGQTIVIPGHRSHRHHRHHDRGRSRSKSRSRHHHHHHRSRSSEPKYIGY